MVIDIASGQVLRECGYLLTAGTGISEIIALNDHEILVDERDGSGLGNGNAAKVKQIFKVDLAAATDVSSMDGLTAAAHAAPKTLVLDLVKLLVANGIPATQIPAKIEGLAFGPDVTYQQRTLHTLWVANDNDFLEDYSGPDTNPNQFFCLDLPMATWQGQPTCRSSCRIQCSCFEPKAAFKRDAAFHRSDHVTAQTGAKEREPVTSARSKALPAQWGRPAGWRRTRPRRSAESPPRLQRAPAPGCTPTCCRRRFP